MHGVSDAAKSGCGPPIDLYVVFDQGDALGISIVPADKTSEEHANDLEKSGYSTVPKIVKRATKLLSSVNHAMRAAIKVCCAFDVLDNKVALIATLFGATSDEVRGIGVAICDNV